MELYITRHGQTKANVEKYMQGQTPGELTREGCQQAKEFGIYYKDIKFDQIYCSDLLRAKKSLEIILEENIHKENNKDILVYTDKIREVNCKSFEYQPCSLYSKLKNNPPERFRFNKSSPQDETDIDIFYRTSLFLDDLIHKNISQKYQSGKNKESVYQLNEEADKISAEEVVSLWEEKKLSIIDDNENKDLKKILVLCHGGAIAEIINNLLYRMMKYVTLKRVFSQNTGLFVVQIFLKDNCEQKEIIKDDDLIFNFKLFNDTKHLNKNN